MAAIVVNSNEYANVVAVPPVSNPPYYWHGRVRIARFSYTTTGSEGIGSTINLAVLPPNALPIYGWIDTGAMGASATLSIGYAGSTSALASALDVSAAAQKTFCNTVALSWFTNLPSTPTTLIGTTGGATFASAKTLYGWVLYVID